VANNLNKINHVVVLMLENRSFDNMAGWLYDPQNPAPYDKVPRNQPFEGVSGKSLSNPVPGGGPAPLLRGSPLTNPEPDPGEEFDHISLQVYGQTPAPNPLPPVAPMNGFVSDYAAVIADYNKKHKLNKSKTNPATIMGCYTPDQVPVTSALANNYAICDYWFASVPSQTWPNRSFAHAATSSGRVNNNNPGSSIPVRNNTPTIFNLMQKAGLGWRVYYDAEDVLSLTLIAQDQLVQYHKTNFSYMGQFYKDAAKAGGLPAYSFIEPRFLLNHNDQHPGGLFNESVGKGEQLISDVYNALLKSPDWNEILFIVTYDEHGGCYDHVAPPTTAKPPDPGAPAGQEGFTFNRFGVRVCTLLISPLIEPGTVFRADKTSPPFDHTSIIKTITNRWGLSSLTQRDAAAQDVGNILTLSTPRSRKSIPDIMLPHAMAAAAAAATDANEPLSDFQRDFVAAAAERLVPFKKALVQAPEPKTVGEASALLKARAQSFKFVM
jgi:phospholipase C